MRTKLAWFLVLLMSSAVAQAATGNLVGKVRNMLIDDFNYGGCMALMVPGPETVAGVTCEAQWVTFSCTGDFSTKSQAQTKVSAAQLAQVTQYDLFVTVDDTKKHNGYCFATRVDTTVNQ